jgi:hypothetical protein
MAPTLIDEALETRIMSVGQLMKTLRKQILFYIVLKFFIIRQIPIALVE